MLAHRRSQEILLGEFDSVMTQGVMPPYALNQSR
jgi:hypothetical protein